MMKSLLIGLVIAAGCGVQDAADDNATDGAQASGEGKGDQATQKAGVKTLDCTGGPAFERFTATLDSSGFDPGSGYFDVRNARVIDNYASAELLCTGHQLEEIDCIGFWFGIGDYIAEVTTQKTSTGLTASHTTLRGGLVGPGGPWACTVK